MQKEQTKQTPHSLIGLSPLNTAGASKAHKQIIQPILLAWTTFTKFVRAGAGLIGYKARNQTNGEEHHTQLSSISLESVNVSSVRLPGVTWCETLLIFKCNDKQKQ